MAKEDREYNEGPVKVEVGREDKEAAAEEAAAAVTEDAEAQAEAPKEDYGEEGFAHDEDSKPESERDIIARKYAEKKEKEIAAASPIDVASESATPEPEGESPEPGEGSDEPSMVQVKVDGETFMVDAKDIEDAGGVRAYQKERAADKRFRELAAQQQAFQEQVRQFNAQVDAQPPSPPQENTGSLSPKDDGPDKQDLAMKALQAMYEGEEEQAAQYLVELTAGNEANASIDRQSLIQDAAQTMAQDQYKRDVAEGREDFINDYPTIARRPDLWAKAAQMTNTIASEHPSWRPQRVMKEAGRRIMDEEEAKAKAAGGTKAEKLAAKRRQTNVGQTTGRGKPPPPPQHQSDSDYVKSLLKQRGLGKE